MENERVAFSHGEGRLVARICGEVDHHTARLLRERIDREAFLVRPRVLVIDLSAVGFMDSSGIALIIGRVEVAAEFGGVVQITGATQPVKKLIRLSGIERIQGLTVSP
ncbi:MAG: anti-sigma factor antagonist [Clostridia bacterium]|nr:anti-sigma factor antagonist [Clostridia bacterium]